MRVLLVLSVFNILIFSRLQAADLKMSLPPGCDTLITTDGTMYLVRVEWQNKHKIRFSRCDGDGGRTYILQMDKVRALKPYFGPDIIEVPVPITPAPIGSAPAPERPQIVIDTFDVLTLMNGRQYRVVILERDYINTYYRLYDQPADDREYVVSNNEVRSVRFAESHNKLHRPGSGTTALIIGAVVLILLLII